MPTRSRFTSRCGVDQGLMRKKLVKMLVRCNSGVDRGTVTTIRRNTVSVNLPNNSTSRIPVLLSSRIEEGFQNSSRSLRRGLIRNLRWVDKNKVTRWALHLNTHLSKSQASELRHSYHNHSNSTSYKSIRWTQWATIWWGRTLRHRISS